MSYMFNWNRWLNALLSSCNPVKRRGTHKSLRRPLSRRLNVEQLESRTLMSSGPTTLSTDKPDYAPGTTAIISGTGFQVGETVQLQVLHTDGLPNSGPDHAPWDVTDGYTGPAYMDAAGFMHLPDLDGKVDGNIQTSWTMDADAANSSFVATAVGLSSADTAQATFTDSQPAKVTNVSSTAANGTYTTGAVIPNT
jgi:hypothetical protein